ncbi:hypothetical protein [Aquicella lusitana]|uniref:Uncharacterized protein n=1 Tax=Aquicella lusitana TaxID=254246 RepID=A0A370GH20_9COXI|nr:hypothetical protein [Aquicella lusitana]RDI41684.1 hypothetical protein C8D86_1187 [Aquicella lusitana]VVC72660.1 hypothetical protein AQULUS_03740 [Aquicella lusitana]
MRTILLAHLKKMAALIVSAIAISIFCFAPIRAQEDTTTTTPDAPAEGQTSEYYLSLIAQYTYLILGKINGDISTYLKNISDMAVSWNTQDNSTESSQLQQTLTSYGNSITTVSQAQTALQTQILTDLFGPTVTSENLNYANDLVYQSLYGVRRFDPDPRRKPDGSPANVDSAYNYIKTASGFNIRHPLPPLGGPDPDAISRYFANYSTVMAAESFNSYVLSGLYEESRNGGPLNQLQTSLVQQATQSSWFTAIGGENLGIVLRQILMFESQAYVLMTQLLQTQKQQLAAQTLTNTLLILNNEDKEKQLYSKATGTRQPM